MEWPTVKLGDVCKIEKEQFREGNLPYVGLEDIEGFTGRFLGGLDPRAVASSTFKFSSSHVLYGRLRPYLNKVLVPNFEGHCSSEIFPLKPTSQLNRSYLYYWLSSDRIVSAINETCTGARMPRANVNTILTFEIPLPPLPEQKRLVAILDEVFADIEQVRAKTEQNLKNARELFESYLQQVFSQRGEGWKETVLGALGKVSMCKRILKKQTAVSGDIPFYKIGTFGRTANAFIGNDIYQEYKEKYSFPKKGDILISAAGTIGRRVIYDGQPAYFQDSNIVWIDNDEKMILNNYLYQFYGVCDWNPSKGATISRLYNDDLRKIKISFPSISEQKELVVRMVALSEKIKTTQINYQKKLEKLDELKKSILQKAFSGELTQKNNQGAVA
ncbi:restriction endonuclease subunit S [Denitrificimonas caeni]|uniref:restriction endonuclease subunit S n=1 Tax=Denitrificimonas caeni TaxID=521720 RepID=UPI001E509E86|nr:restriction endonuclease subunit S [Denitrificimonas caeni]